MGTSFIYYYSQWMPVNRLHFASAYNLQAERGYEH